MYFKANLFLTLLAVLVLALLLSLGCWQLDRAQQKQDLIDLQLARLGLRPVDFSTIDLTSKSLRYLPIKVSGRLDTEHQILIDNQIKNGQVGFFVLTPLRLDKDSAILLNRGWIALGGDRNELPNIEIAIEDLAVVGKLDRFPSVGIKLEGSDELSKGWPSVTHVVEVNKVAIRLGYSVYPYQVLLNSDEAEGYDREWVFMQTGPEKHHGYAFQWFALATAWIVIYFVLTIKKRK